MPGKEKPKQCDPCPFCGCDNIIIESILGPEAKGLLKRHAHARAKCSACGAERIASVPRTSDTIDDHTAAQRLAIEFWNQRDTADEHRDTREVESAQWRAEKGIERARGRMRRSFDAALKETTVELPGDLN